MPRVTVIASVSIGALAVCLSYLIYRKRKRLQESPAQDKYYHPVVDVDRYHVHIISSVDQLPAVIEEFAESARALKVVGLDCEWVTMDGKRKPVALLQLASPHSSTCLLFRLDQMAGELPECILQILEDRSIYKVGVGVVDDANRLRKDYDIETQGCLDLRQMALRHLPRSLRGRSLGLHDLAGIICSHEMLKDDAVRCSNWEADPLSCHQVDYAAMDAIIGAAIFLRIVAIKMELGSLEAFAVDKAHKSMASLCQGLLDKNPNVQTGSQRLAQRAASRPKPSKNLVANGNPPPLSKAYKARQSAKYDNTRLLAPDGRLLCVCNRRKALWYVEREIGELVTEEPLSVRLLFEPAGIPGPDGEYYLLEKANRCCVCGREDSYIKKNIVPHEYRRHFPDYLKKHSSHDVILLCLACHQRSCDFDTLTRQNLEQRYDAPISNKTNAKLVEDPVRVRVRSCARALMRHKKSQSIPPHRLQELTETLQDFYQVGEIDDAILAEAVDIETKVDNRSYEGSHGWKVVKGVMEGAEGGLAEFEKMWRRNFLENMEPCFMPALWSVDHRHEAAVCSK
ncbi:exonuclease 3'-5' domain-containing protein 2-like [Diadema antillarum]|uniref:exonuclease 3'-5' domain-containing protein 2-like n=1 Tax=Diadema antillarum TaxID=105358 RepID=UPI003A878F90